MNARNASWRTIVIITLGLFAATGGSRHASALPDQRSFLLGTGSTEGPYHPVGVALSTLVKLKLLPSLNLDLTAVNTSGSEENIDLLREGEVQFGIISALSGYEAERGIGRFAGFEPDETLRAITALWFNTDHVVVKNADVQSGMVDDLRGLRGGKLSLGRAGSGTFLGNRAIMASLGLNLDDFDLVEFDDLRSAEALASGEIAGMSVSAVVPDSAVQRAFDLLGDEAALLEFNDEQLTQVDQGRRLWGRVVIPAGTYAEQERDIFTIGTPNILVVRADVDDEVVYQITRTIFEDLDYLHSLHDTTRQISLDTAVANLPLPIHGGALRYFEEKDVDLPPPPVDIDPDLLARFDSTAQAREAVNRGRISMFAGADGDTSARAAAELAALFDENGEQIRLLPTYGGGSGQNLTDLLYLKDVDLALVRNDIVAYAVEQNVYPSVDTQIAYMTEMFPEEVHLVVRKGITDIRDLPGKRVDTGARGSGSNITASVILSRLDIPVETTNFGGHMALDKLQRGEIDAAFVVGGKPMPLLQDIEAESGITLLPVPFVQYADSYRPASIGKRDYPNLITAAPAEEISTIAVRTALFSYAWRPGTPRYEALATFSTVLFDHLDDLHQDGHHPKWREVDPTSEMIGWTRFDPARTWVEDHFEEAQAIALEGRKLMDQSLLAEPDPHLQDKKAPPPSSLGAALAPKAPLKLEEGRLSLPEGGEQDDESQPEMPLSDDQGVTETPASGQAIDIAPPSSSSDAERPFSSGSGGPKEPEPGEAVGSFTAGWKAQPAGQAGRGAATSSANRPTF